MNSRKKLIISLSSLGLAIVAAIGITFGVLAAQTQTVTNTFTVSYQATNVAASVYAKYKLENDDNYTYFTGENTDSITVGGTSVAALTFTPADSQSTGTLTATGLNLGTKGEDPNTYFDNYAILAFAFRNNATAGADPMYVTLTDSAVLNSSTRNVKIYHFASASDNETVANIKGSAQYTQVQWDALVESTDSDEISALYETNFPEGTDSSFADKKAALAAVPGIVLPANLYTGSAAKTLYTGSIAAQATKYVYILVEIDDATIGAGYASDSTNGLSWALTHVNPQQQVNNG